MRQGSCFGHIVSVPFTKAWNERSPFFAEQMWRAVGPAKQAYSSERQPRAKSRPASPSEGKRTPKCIRNSEIGFASFLVGGFDLASPTSPRPSTPAPLRQGELLQALAHPGREWPWGHQQLHPRGQGQASRWRRWEKIFWDEPRGSDGDGQDCWRKPVGFLHLITKLTPHFDPHLLPISASTSRAPEAGLVLAGLKVSEQSLQGTKTAQGPQLGLDDEAKREQKDRKEEGREQERKREKERWVKIKSSLRERGVEVRSAVLESAGPRA